MAVRLRAAVPSDLSAIREIYASSVGNAVISFACDPPGVADLETKSEQKTDYPWLVCGLDGEVTGYAYAGAIRERTARRWVVEVLIYVRPKFQRRGVVRGPYTTFLDLLERQGYVLAVAIITTSNPVSTAFRESFGLKHVGRFERIGYKNGAWHDVKR